MKQSNIKGFFFVCFTSHSALYYRQDKDSLEDIFFFSYVSFLPFKHISHHV